MTIKAYLGVVAIALCAGLTVSAADKVEAGPKGGRILEKTTPKAEFFIENDRTVSITFYDSAGKVVAPADRLVSVIADSKDGRKTLEFEKKGDALVSKTKLPEGDANNVVVQLRQAANATPQNFRFKANTSTCGGCKRAEYACICDE
jgi:hypothetical protein